MYGLHPIALLALYLFLILLPLGLAFDQDLPARPFRDDLSSALAIVAFAMLLMEFVISGRYRTLSGQIGIDISMRFHQMVARSLTVALIVHPWLYTLPVSGGAPGDVTAATQLRLGGAPAVTGVIAWLALIVLVAWASFRDVFGYRYETWRICHAFGALIVALLGLHHTLGVGRYSADERLAWLWYAYTAIAIGAMLFIYLVRPLIKLRRRYRVVSVAPVALKTWELELEPERGDAIPFAPGQFAWLSIGRSAFSTTEHPFSMSSSPGDRPRVAFAIKEVGDFTSTIGAIPIGASAYLDGPHGNMVTTGRSGVGLVLIAGGVGLAPIMSMLRQARHDREPQPIRLIYGNRIEDQIMFQHELDAMCGELNLEVIHVLSEPPSGWTGRVGQLDAETLRKILQMPDRARWIYVVCGPSAMIDSVEQSLESLGVPLRQIVSEKFSYD